MLGAVVCRTDLAPTHYPTSRSPHPRIRNSAKLRPLPCSPTSTRSTSRTQLALRRSRVTCHGRGQRPGVCARRALLGPDEMGPEKLTLLFLAVCFLVALVPAPFRAIWSKTRRRDVGGLGRRRGYLSSRRTRRAAIGRRLRPQLAAQPRRAFGDLLRDARRGFRRFAQRRSVGCRRRARTRSGRRIVALGVIGAGMFYLLSRFIPSASSKRSTRRRGHAHRAGHRLRVPGAVRARGDGDEGVAARFVQSLAVFTFGDGRAISSRPSRRRSKWRPNRK